MGSYQVLSWTHPEFQSLSRSSDAPSVLHQELCGHLCRTAELRELETQSQACVAAHLGLHP